MSGLEKRQLNKAFWGERTAAAPNFFKFCCFSTHTIEAPANNFSKLQTTTDQHTCRGLHREGRGLHKRGQQVEHVPSLAERYFSVASGKRSIRAALSPTTDVGMARHVMQSPFPTYETELNVTGITKVQALILHLPDRCRTHLPDEGNDPGQHADLTEAKRRTTCHPA